MSEWDWGVIFSKKGLPIDKDLLRHVKLASSRYKLALENRRQEDKDLAAAAAARKRKAQEIAQLEKEKDQMERDLIAKRAALESRIEALRK